MIQIRRCLHNPLRVTLISTLRKHRPHYTKSRLEEVEKGSCPFCPGNEHLTPPAILVLLKLNNEKYAFSKENKSGELKEWVVRVFPNKYPALIPNSRLNEAYGYHEVLVESRIHSENEYLVSKTNVYLALKTLKKRVSEILKDNRIRHVIIIKNKGAMAGASVLHPHLQIFANTFIPPEIEAEISRFEEFFRKNNACPLCYLASSKKELIFFRNNSFLAMAAYAPRVPYEVLILPIKHQSSFLETSGNELRELGEALSEAVFALKKTLGDISYNFWFHTVYDSSLSFYHWHIEILPLTTTWGGYERGSGVYIVDRFPEAAASELRKAISSET